MNFVALARRVCWQECAPMSCRAESSNPTNAAEEKWGANKRVSVSFGKERGHKSQGDWAGVAGSVCLLHLCTMQLVLLGMKLRRGVIVCSRSPSQQNSNASEYVCACVRVSECAVIRACVCVSVLVCCEARQWA